MLGFAVSGQMFSSANIVLIHSLRLFDEAVSLQYKLRAIRYNSSLL